MLKKIISWMLVIAITASIAVTGTVAYLQSVDSDVNVMTLGNVKIEQIEQERDADGTLKDFSQAKPAFPAVGPIEWAEKGVTVNEVEYKVFTDDLKNVVDKIVTVKNTGKSDAYVRTIVAIEAPDYDPDNLIHINYNSTDVSITDIIEVTLDGVDYVAFVFTYEEALAPSKVSAPSLMQVFLDSATTNKDCEKFGETWEIIVLSQAVQAEGFDDAETALNTGFGELNADNVKKWFPEIYIPDYALPEAEIDSNGVINLENGEKVVLSGNKTSVEIKGEGTVYLRNTNINGSVEVADDAKINLVVEGNVSVKGTEGSAITGKVLNISGTPGATLTAIAADTKGSFGIGGMGTTDITIKDLTIKEVVGGYDGEIGTDTKYYKDAPEGGSAIGSNVNGANITLENVHIEKAIGGSKSAGIGARYHIGVNITIKNSTIDYVEGGASAAGIGGSRISGEGTENGNKIEISDSKINAVGGVYGAGIGSGYDTHCGTEQPITEINIKGNSVITAQGGQYAAGIGTGYHHAGLKGVIENTVTVNATSGEKFYKDTYTQAQDIGFGVVDPEREAKDNSSSITYKDTVIAIPKV